MDVVKFRASSVGDIPGPALSAFASVHRRKRQLEIWHMFRRESREKVETEPAVMWPRAYIC